MANFKKQSTIQVWFLDDDLRKSAEYLTNEALDRTIDGIYAILVDAVFYFIGIRNKKAYAYYFHRDRRDLTMEKRFPNWPFRKPPTMRYYTARTSKWARMCAEHFGYMKEYLEFAMLEYEYRRGRAHKLRGFLDWLDVDMPQTGLAIPAAGVSKICLPWKSLKKKFRRREILDGYRLQFMDTFCWEDPIGAYDGSNRDVPDFVIRHYGLDVAQLTS